jgi:subtilisin family serine protease
VPAARVSATKSRLSSYAPDEVIVKFKAGAPQLHFSAQDERLITIARMAGKQGGETRAEQLVSSTANQRISRILTERGLDRVFVLKLEPGSDVPATVSELRAREDVEYAEPNYLVRPGTVIPNDPEFIKQWALLNNGIIVDEFFATTPNADIKAYKAWDFTTGGPDVIVAVSDTGVDLDHPDLARNIYTNPLEIPANGIDDDKNGFVDDVHGFNVADQNGDTSDAVGHGTQMAGIIAAEMNNEIGISGVCQSKVLPVRFFRRTGPAPSDFSATVADAARSLIYSIVAGASIINASWSTVLDPDLVSEEVALALADAVKATNDAGVLLVCIAGNEGYNLDLSKLYPASYFLPNQIVVAASDYNDQIWRPIDNPYFIQTGFGPNTVNLAAPGVSVLTTKARGSCLLCTDETDPLQWYTSATGTSVSAACVSGVAALVKSRYPDETAILLKRRILEGVEVTESLAGYVLGAGRLSAIGALTSQVSITPPTLQQVIYKKKKEKLVLYGSDIQNGASVLVGTAAYPGKPKSGDGTAVLVKGVPVSAFPAGVPIKVKLRNPDGGESQAVTFIR